jgi:hypothetical protein
MAVEVLTAESLYQHHKGKPLNYLYFLAGIIFGISIMFILYKRKFKDLSNLRYQYLLSQEEQTRLVKDKVFQIELDLYNFKASVLSNKDVENI